MATLCKTYPAELLARRAVDALRAAGVPARDIRVLSGSRFHDVRREPVGRFAGEIAPDAPCGTYAGVRRRRGQGAGAFAGDPDAQRQGSFGDVDVDVIRTYERGEERTRVAGDFGLRALLRTLAVPGDAAAAVVAAIHAGGAVVVAEVAEIAPEDALSRLEDVARVA